MKSDLNLKEAELHLVALEHGSNWFHELWRELVPQLIEDCC